MIPLKVIARFFVFTLVIYVLLIVRWPGVREAYRAAYCATGEALFGRFGSHGVVHFESRTGDKINDVDLVLGKRTPQGIAEVPAEMSSGRIGYAPLAAVVALVLATPVPWPRRWQGLLWGFLLVNLFVVLRTGLRILFLYSAPSPIRLYEPGPFLSKLLASSYEFFFLAPACSFFVPAVVWVVVTVRSRDFDRILRPQRASPPVAADKE